MRALILGFLAVAPIVALALWRWSPLAAIGVVFASHMLVLYPTLRPTSQWLGPVITSFRTTQPEVWLTIDDGPDPLDTPAILDLLRVAGARATFFVKGRLAEKHPELVESILRDGHELANHSQTHPSGSFWALPPGRIAGEIDRCNAVLEKATGLNTPRFRSPVGMKNPFVHPILERRSMKLIGWTARGFDGVRSQPALVTRRILRDVRPGAIILMHEGVSSRDGARTSVECIGSVVTELGRLGYRLVIPAESQLRTGS